MAVTGKDSKTKKIKKNKVAEAKKAETKELPSQKNAEKSAKKLKKKKTSLSTSFPKDINTISVLYKKAERIYEEIVRNYFIKL